MPVLHCLDYHSFEIRKCEIPALFFFMIILPIKGPLRFHMGFRMEFSVSAKNTDKKYLFLYFLVVQLINYVSFFIRT